MLIYIIRHGETEANEGGYLQGWSNTSLNNKGILLAEITGKKMKDIKFDVCISSPLKRAKETAEIVLKESGNSCEIIFDERIKEINMGDWEKRKFRPSESEVDSEKLSLFFTDTFSFAGFPGGENIKQLCDRTQAFLKEIISLDDGKTYLVSTHGAALRAMINYLHEDNNDFWRGHVPYNCSITVVEAKNHSAKIIQEDLIFYDDDLIIDRYKEF